MWDLPWTNSVTLINKQVIEGLLKYGKGDRKVKFSIPINWIDELDVLSNFTLQEPWGLDKKGKGESGRYYYVESLTYDFLNHKIEVVGVDLQYILRQCMIIPHCGDVAETWEEASEADRMYAYVGSCATESFSDGEPLKILCPCDKKK